MWRPVCRTYDKYSPFPEEMNRKLVSSIADLYFCPTVNNKNNLAAGEYHRGAVRHRQYGDRRAEDHGPWRIINFSTDESEPPALRGEKDHPRHLPPPGELRRAHEEHHDWRCGRSRRRIPEVELVYPVHLSPVVREAVDTYLRRRTPGAPHRPAACRRDAQPHGPVLPGA